MEWREYHGYLVSDSGLITRKNSTELQQTKLHKRGYVLCHISINGKKSWRLLHRIVATVFIPNPENKPQVNHIDGNKQNNNVSNLEWVTNSENRQHAVNNALISFGDKLSKKLDSNLVKEIKKLYVKGSHKFGSYELAKKFGVSPSMILHIVSGEAWKSVNV